MRNTIITKDRQSVLDLAVQQAGDATAAIELAIANDLSLTEKLAPGTGLKKSGIKNEAVTQFLKSELKSPATIDNEVIEEGIGFWRIGIDFKIS